MNRQVCAKCGKLEVFSSFVFLHKVRGQNNLRGSHSRLYRKSMVCEAFEFNQIALIGSLIGPAQMSGMTGIRELMAIGCMKVKQNYLSMAVG